MAYIRIESRFNGQPAGKTGTHDCRTRRGLARILRTYRTVDGWRVVISMTRSTARLLGAACLYWTDTWTLHLPGDGNMPVRII